MHIQKPRIINLPITEVCDSRCIMCNVWNAGKSDAFTASESTSLFAQPFFQKVQHIGLSGGEPTLNPHLVQIVDAICSSLPALKTVSMTSHGYHTQKHQALLPQISSICKKRGVAFSLNLSMDGYKTLHEKIRRIPDAFGKMTATAALAKSLGIHVQLQCTISPLNAYGIVSVREFALENGYEVVFRIASYIARLSNKNLSESIQLDEKARSFVADFLESPRTIYAANSLGRRLFYSDLAHRLKYGSTRVAPCAFQKDALFISPSKEIFNCSRSEASLAITNPADIASSVDSKPNQAILEDLVTHTCTECYHDQSGRWPLYKYFTVHSRFRPYFGTIRKAQHAPSLLRESAFPFQKHAIQAPSHAKRMFLVGCYGGEHVGDAAILGGVILRLKEKYGAREFDVRSFRPDRTRCWVQGLRIEDVTIRVIDADAVVDPQQYDAVVWAGGPLMSLPILVKDISQIVRKFQQHQKPFLIEGSGIGPINDSLTERIIFGLIRTASAITVRTQKDFQSAQALNGTTQKNVDPAFDYLSYALKQPIAGHSSLSALTSGGKEIWVINLRPMWSRYSKDSTSASATGTIHAIAAVLDQYKDNRCFIFMPMNPDQFGFSDLEPAYHLRRLMESRYPDVDYRTWEYEPSIDDCLALLQHARLTIAMRFHACIFALAAGIPTIGLDYSTGEKGKVHALFDDRGLADNVIGIKELTAEHLSRTIQSVYGHPN